MSSTAAPVGDGPPSPLVMAEGLSMRYDAPAAALAEAITSYAVYTARPRDERVDWFLPGTSQISVTLDAGPITINIRRRTYHPMPDAALIGPSSQAMRAVTHGGTMIGIGLTALGWARLFSRSASEWRDRVVPLADALSPAVAAELRAVLAATDRNREVKPALDAFFARHLGPPHADEARIRRLSALIVDRRIDSLPALIREAGVPAHTLRRLTARHFGFPPKLLLLRARFLRAFTRIVHAGEVMAFPDADSGYYDASHFLRDARTFLGTTPKRFMAQPTAFLQASLYARQAVLGAPAQVLHTIAPEPLDAPPAAP